MKHQQQWTCSIRSLAGCSAPGQQPAENRKTNPTTRVFHRKGRQALEYQCSVGWCMVSGSWDARELPLPSPGVRSRTGGEFSSESAESEFELLGVCRTPGGDSQLGPRLSLSGLVVLRWPGMAVVSSAASANDEQKRRFSRVFSSRMLKPVQLETILEAC